MGAELTSPTLPPELIMPEPRKVRYMKPGEAGFVGAWYLMVNRRRHVFVEAMASVEDRKRSDRVDIKRDGGGRFHITVTPDMQFRRRRPGVYPFGIGLRRIASISVRAEEEKTEPERTR